jgi:hypothetical protein
MKQFSKFGMLIWDKPTYGVSLPAQLLQGKVSLSPMFTLMWDAWMQHLQIDKNVNEGRSAGKGASTCKLFIYVWMHVCGGHPSPRGQQSAARPASCWRSVCSELVDR